MMSRRGSSSDRPFSSTSTAASSYWSSASSIDEKLEYPAKVLAKRFDHDEDDFTDITIVEQPDNDEPAEKQDQNDVDDIEDVIADEFAEADQANNEEDVDEEDEDEPTMCSYVNESPSEYRPGGYHPVAVGDNFKQRYFAISKLGWGHYSTVWLCYDTQLNRYCAIKLLKSADLYADSARHEINLLRRIGQLNCSPLHRQRIVKLTDSFSISGVNGTHQCLVFDVMGDDMLKLIQRSDYQGLPIGNVKQIAKQVLQGIFWLHSKAKVIHTDLKPENVLLTADESILRTLANVASKQYLDQQLLTVNDDECSPLTKTAKRRKRSKIKQAISFFQAHRRWLQDRSIADLLQLAQRGHLTPQMAVDAVTGKLPYLPYDGPPILNEAELLSFQRAQQLITEHVGDTKETERTRPRKRPRHDSNSSTNALKMLLNGEMEKFMRHVQQVIANGSQEDGLPYQTPSKRIKTQRPSQQRSLRTVRIPVLPETSVESVLKLIDRKDPALEACPLKVGIADMGNSCFINEHVCEEIQTREYRSIEVILGTGYDTSADLWSAACLFWELATGQYLFDPSHNRDNAPAEEVHVAQIIEALGPLPSHMIERGEHSGQLFDKHGQLLHIKHLHPRPLELVLIKRYKWSSSDATKFVEFLMPMLQLDPSRRVSAFTAIKHFWLQLD